MPDPGEPDVGFDPTPCAAGRTPDGAVPESVHLVLLLPDVPDWSTRCPADVDGLGPGQRSRRAVLTVEPIDCPACLVTAPDTVAAVDERSAAARARVGRDGAVVLRFLRFLREQDPPVVLAAADGTALPISEHDVLLQLWAQAEQQGPGAA